MVIINLKGEHLNNPTFPYLSIVWHNSHGGVYCHHADLYFISGIPDPEQLSCVHVLLDIVTSVTSVPLKRLTKDVWWYLPFRRNQGIVRIPLHSDLLITALDMNDWTKKKTGERNILIGSPKAIEWQFGPERFSYKFDGSNGQTPALLAEKYANKLQPGEKAEVIICLDDTRYPKVTKSLFDEF